MLYQPKTWHPIIGDSDLVNVGQLLSRVSLQNGIAENFCFHFTVRQFL